MALPKIKHPTYAVTIPSTKQQVTIRPFTVQEEKLLLMAKASDKTEDIIACMYQIVKNCVIESIDVDKLATFDIEYIFVKLRAKSISEVVDLEYTDEDVGKVSFQVNLDDVEIKFNSEHTNKVKVYDDIYFKMRYPSLEDIKYINGELTSDNITEILYKCIDQIYDNDEVYTEYTKEELDSFIDNLPIDSISSITKFFDTMPVLEHIVILKNKDGDTKEVVLRGINNFFIF